jgi:hypothetical protein
VVWESIERDTPALYFVLCLAALWFGCVNACCEIVKESAILERERLFGLRPREYVLSKVWVLASLGAAQVILLQGTVEWQLQLRGPMPVEFLDLFGASVAGTGLGLLVSAAGYHAPDLIYSVDIPFLLQRLFTVKPEALDIIDYDIVFSELDSSNLRARVKARVKVKLLLDETIQEREFILCFDRDSIDDPWYMKLEDSLRELSPDSTKQN